MVDKAEMYQKGVSRDEAKTKLLGLLDSNNRAMLWNGNDGEVAFLSKRSVDKIMSNSASDKSMHNGFTREQHYAVVSDIDELFKNSVRVCSHPDRSGAANVLIHRYVVPLYFKSSIAYITVKDSTQHGKRVYSAEIMDAERLEDRLKEAQKIK